MSVSVKEEKVSSGQVFQCWGNGPGWGMCQRSASKKVVVRYGVGHKGKLVGFGCDEHVGAVGARLKDRA